MDKWLNQLFMLLKSPVGEAEIPDVKPPLSVVDSQELGFFFTQRIISSTNARIVLDPFMGSGTTAVVARDLKRDYIGIDISPEYCSMAKERLKEPIFLKYKNFF
jgi:modification methylase